MVEILNAKNIVAVTVTANIIKKLTNVRLKRKNVRWQSFGSPPDHCLTWIGGPTGFLVDSGHRSTLISSPELQRPRICYQAYITNNNYNLYAVVHINLLFHHFCHIFIIINCSSRLVQCLGILDVNRKVEEGRGTAGGSERKEGGR